MIMVKDSYLYDKLGVSSDANNEEIQKAYKKLALKYHPDRNMNNLEEANTKLQEINQAKEILTNQEKRNIYDQIGMDFVNGNMPQHQQMNPEDLFNMFGGGFPGGFSGGFPGGFHGHPFNANNKQKENITINKEVTLEEIYNESVVQVNFGQKQSCGLCKGEGTKDCKPSKCETCDGRGVLIKRIQMGPMIQQIQSGCHNCGGSGKNLNANNCCASCNGDGYKLKEVKANIPLKNGLSNGQQIQIPHHGHNLKDGKTDLIIIINEKENERFKRKGNDLLIEINLKLYQAIFGFDKIIEHLDKRKLHISHNSKTEFNTIKKIIGEGMHVINSSDKGDLYVKFNIIMPDITNNEISNKLQYLLKTLDNDESNAETIIKNSKNIYIKTMLLNAENNPFDKEETQNSNPGPYVHQEERVQQQCQQS